MKYNKYTKLCCSVIDVHNMVVVFRCSWIVNKKIKERTGSEEVAASELKSSNEPAAAILFGRTDGRTYDR